MRRCPSTVRTLTCNAAAISLDVLPATQQLHDFALARREVREPLRSRRRVRLVAARAWRSLSIAARMRSSNSLGGAGFCRKSTAPAFSARTEVGTFPWPVRTMMGSIALRRRSSSCRSRPLLCRKRTSSTRQPGALRIVGGEELFARGVRLDRESRRLEQRAQRLAHADVVVDHEDGRVGGHAERLFRAGFGGCSGSVKRTVVPGPPSARRSTQIRPSMRLDDGAADRQAHSQTLRLGGEEGLEQPLRGGGRDAGAGVAHGDFRHALRGPRLQLDLPAVAARFANGVDGVLHQVHDDLLDLDAVRVDRQRLRRASRAAA